MVTQALSLPRKHMLEANFDRALTTLKTEAWYLLMTALPLCAPASSSSF